MNPVVEVAMKAVPFVLVGLVLALFYGLQREKFNVVARGVFLALEKEMHTADGEAKMAEAVQRIIDILPASAKSVIAFAALVTQMSQQEMVLKLCQKTFDLIFPEPTA